MHHAREFKWQAVGTDFQAVPCLPPVHPSSETRRLRHHLGAAGLDGPWRPWSIRLWVHRDFYHFYKAFSKSTSWELRIKAQVPEGFIWPLLFWDVRDKGHISFQEAVTKGLVHRKALSRSPEVLLCSNMVALPCLTHWWESQGPGHSFGLLAAMKLDPGALKACNPPLISFPSWVPLVPFVKPIHEFHAFVHVCIQHFEHQLYSRIFTDSEKNWVNPTRILPCRQKRGNT